MKPGAIFALLLLFFLSCLPAALTAPPSDKTRRLITARSYRMLINDPPRLGESGIHLDPKHEKVDLYFGNDLKHHAQHINDHQKNYPSTEDLDGYAVMPKGDRSNRNELSEKPPSVSGFIRNEFPPNSVVHKVTSIAYVPGHERDGESNMIGAALQAVRDRSSSEHDSKWKMRFFSNHNRPPSPLPHMKVHHQPSPGHIPRAGPSKMRKLDPKGPPSELEEGQISSGVEEGQISSGVEDGEVESSSDEEKTQVRQKGRGFRRSSSPPRAPKLGKRKRQ